MRLMSRSVTKNWDTNGHTGCSKTCLYIIHIISYFLSTVPKSVIFTLNLATLTLTFWPRTEYYSRITLDWTKSEVAAIYRISSHKWIQTQFMAQSSVGCAVVNLHISQILRGHLFCWLRAQRAGADVSATRCVRRQKERWSVCEEWGERCRRLTRKLYVLAWRLTAAWRNERRRPCARLNWGLGVKATRQDRVTVVCRW